MTRSIRFCFTAALLALPLSAGDYPRTLYAYPGRTPVIDGVLSDAEWDDALQFTGPIRWVSQLTPVTDPKDLSVRVYVKHDDQRLYFAFDINDDVLYGIDTPRWLPSENPKANELTKDGWPWFGDSVELFLNASNRWSGAETPAGTGASWAMVCNLEKSHKGGVGKGGLVGDPPTHETSADTYGHWIDTGAQEAAIKAKPGGKGYIIEWAIRFNPCLQVEPGRFYSPSMGDRPMGLNIAIRDADEQEKGKGNFANLHHEAWFAGVKDTENQLRKWGTLWMMAQPARETKPVKILR